MLTLHFKNRIVITLISLSIYVYFYLFICLLDYLFVFLLRTCENFLLFSRSRFSKTNKEESFALCQTTRYFREMIYPALIFNALDGD